jgi:hypothetical protein
LGEAKFCYSCGSAVIQTTIPIQAIPSTSAGLPSFESVFKSNKAQRNADEENEVFSYTANLTYGQTNKWGKDTRKESCYKTAYGTRRNVKVSYLY